MLRTSWAVVACGMRSPSRSALRLGIFGLLLTLVCATGQSSTPPGSGPPQDRAQPEMTPPRAAVAPGVDAAGDPTVTDPDNYRMVMENDRVRVLRYHDVPGTKTHRHRHPDSVLYALSTFRRRLTFPDGTTKEREFVRGDVMWIPAQTHIGENIGTTDTEVLLVEVKSP